MSVTSIDLNLREKLKNHDYRCVFFETKLADEVAHELKTIRETHNMRQSDLAERSGMKQTAISRIERSEEANWNIKTLLRLALALDCRLKIVFQPIKEAIGEIWPEENNKNTSSLVGGWQTLPMPSHSAMGGAEFANNRPSALFPWGVRQPQPQLQQQQRSGLLAIQERGGIQP